MFNLTEYHMYVHFLSRSTEKIHGRLGKLQPSLKELKSLGGFYF